VANYLLGADAFATYLVGRPKSPTPDQARFWSWAQKLTDEDWLCVSRISVAMLFASIERIADPADRNTRRKSVTTRIKEQFADQTLEVDEAVLGHWSTIRASVDDSKSWPDGSLISTEQMLEIASALNNGYVLVTRRTLALDDMTSRFTPLAVIDPWA
jgi:hypothetical protein